jgi:hypothetical protein
MDRPVIVLSSGLVHQLDDDTASASEAAWLNDRMRRANEGA